VRRESRTDLRSEFDVMNDSKQAAEDRKSTALVWEQGNYAGSNAYLPVGEKRVKIASTSWSTTRNDPEPWVLSTSLPGFYGKTWKFAEHEAAQEKAERLLSSFALWIQTAKDAARD
jgi:hypothetical protein